MWCAGSFALLVECQSRSPSAPGSSHARTHSTSLRLRNLHTTLSCMLVYLAIHHALEGAGPCQKTWCDSPHLHSLWSIAPPEASTVHAVCLVEEHPNDPSSERSKCDCGPRVSKCPKHVCCEQLRRSCQNMSNSSNNLTPLIRFLKKGSCQRTV